MMTEPTFQQQAVIWGQTYELLVKRGVLACLIEQQLVAADHPRFAPWKQHRLLEVTQALYRGLNVIDDTQREQIKAAVAHLALTAYGTGYSATRDYLRYLPRMARKSLTVRALWCPLLLPGDTQDINERRRRDREAFHREFALQGVLDPHLSAKGQPANADFVLWLSSKDEDYLLVQEYAFDMPSRLGDFREPDAHLAELTRHRRHIDSRGVFTRITAEVDDELFVLSDDLKQHLNALTRGNKPFYKLCQGCSYAANTAIWLRNDRVLTKPCQVRALAITPNGLDSLSARFVADSQGDPRRQLMEQLGAAYRRARKLADGDDEGLRRQVESVFRNLLMRLPTTLKNSLKTLNSEPAPGDDYRFEFSETLEGFANPADACTVAQALTLVPDTAKLTDFFGQPAPEILQPLLNARAQDEQITLRDLHAAAVVAGLQRSTPGRINVIALEGNPGIGKTTAVRVYLERQSAGFLFLYLSPRVVINRDVTQNLARCNEQPSGILTLTTNAALIASAPRWHRAQVQAGRATSQQVDGAVVADGVPALVKPQGAILVITPEEEQAIEAGHPGSRWKKTTLSEQEDLVDERPLTGVLSSLSTTARKLLELNPTLNRVVLTAALQGFREKSGGKTTLTALSKLFKSKAGDPAGVRERRAFAKRIPHLVVMVDELTGDGAGAPFVHAITAWLHDEFIGCFEDAASPFTVTLVISDASLTNELVLARYLATGQMRAPDKILVSASSGQRAFDLAVSKLRLGTGGTKTVFHVMTNSFPATTLRLEYRVQLTAVTPQVRDSGEMETVRQAVRRVMDTTALGRARQEILQALHQGSAQVIYFAQDKAFLSDLKAILRQEAEIGRDQVAILDSSVPAHQRQHLVKPAVRDTKKVFLMTSSGARGVSFPKTDCIIAVMPRFQIEAALMELAQLIYRGRGRYQDARGAEVCGDRVPRRLVLLIDDYLVTAQEALDPQHWLRQSIDLLTLLVMLRSTLFTRITGDAGLRQPLALVPVGRTGVEELVSLMSQSVTQFLKEADVAWRRVSDPALLGLVKNAQANMVELFSHIRLQANTHRAADCRTMARHADARALVSLATDALRPLLVYADQGTSIPEHLFAFGPMFLEHWGDFDTSEIFGFDGHTIEINQMASQLIRQLRAIAADSAFAPGLRRPADALAKILKRDPQHAGQQFNIFKYLKSPNTWIAIPCGYSQFMAHDRRLELSRSGEIQAAEEWREALAQSLSATSALLPPIARYADYPWVASVGHANPLQWETVFDDRYFMASNEMNLLNTFLLAAVAASTGQTKTIAIRSSGY